MRMNQCHERVGPAFVFHKSGIDIQMQRRGVSIAGLRNSHRVGLQRGGKGIKASRKPGSGSEEWEMGSPANLPLGVASRFFP